MAKSNLTPATVVADEVKPAKMPIDRVGKLIRSKPGAPVVLLKRGGRGGSEVIVQYQHPDAKQGSVDAAIREKDTYMLSHAILNPRMSGVVHRAALLHADNIAATSGIGASNLDRSPVSDTPKAFPAVVASFNEAVRLTTPAEPKQITARSGSNKSKKSSKSKASKIIDAAIPSMQ